MQCHYLLIKQLAKLANLNVDKIHKLTQECKDLVRFSSHKIKTSKDVKKTVQKNLKIVLLFKIEL